MDEGLSTTGRRMLGYALKWQHPAFIRTHGQTFEERFARGAFAKSVAAGQVRLCLDHDRDAIVASQDSGSLLLVEDDVGLFVDAWANDSIAGDDAMSAVRSGFKVGLSVGFERPVSKWQDSDSGRVRVIVDCSLVEVSVVRNPAYRSSELHAGRMRIEAFETRNNLTPAARARLRMAAKASARGIPQ
jgi:HK97 family phage prohead protease